MFAEHSSAHWRDRAEGGRLGRLEVAEHGSPALAAGVPQVIVPLFALNQLVSAEHVAAAEAGLRVDGGSEGWLPSRMPRHASRLSRRTGGGSLGGERDGRAAIRNRRRGLAEAQRAPLTRITYRPCAASRAGAYCVTVSASDLTARLNGAAAEWMTDSVGGRRSGSGQPLSICLYTPSADPSGMGTHMLDLTAEYVPEHAVSLMCWPTGPGKRVLARAAALGATTLALPHPRDPAFSRVIIDFLHGHRADVFHLHVGTGRENFDGARAARAAGVPAVVQTQHLPWLLSSRGKRPPFFRGLREVGHLIGVSKAVGQTYVRIGVPAGRISTVPNGVGSRGAGPGRLAVRRSLGLDPDQLVVMTIGRLATMKGHCDLIDSTPTLLADFPGLVVLIVGDGHLWEQLTRQAAALGVGDRVRLLGRRPDARELLDAADVFVLPSLHEGMPLVALEAMEASLPVVATRVIGSDEVVVHGETGLLVPAQDAPALSRALTVLLADPMLRTRLGEAGRRRYLARFTRRRMAADTLAVYSRVLTSVGAMPVGSSN